MKGRSKFTSDEAEKIRRLLRQKVAAGRDEQKVIRARIRRIRFYISDFELLGCTAADFDALVREGRVRIERE